MKINHYVPLDVVEKYWKSFQCPAKFEGWDEITLHNKIELNPNTIFEYDYLMKSFNQNNPNHSLTLGNHSDAVWYTLLSELDIYANTTNEELLKEYGAETLHLVRGAYLHDVGKLFTRVPNKKDPTYDSYYSHAEVGAYFKICNGWTPGQVKYETYHMHPYQWKTEKAHSKWKKIFGEEFYNNLLILNKCDIEAH